VVRDNDRDVAEVGVVGGEAAPPLGRVVAQEEEGARLGGPDEAGRMRLVERVRGAARGSSEGGQRHVE
jgi:hypothetical protein